MQVLIYLNLLGLFNLDILVRELKKKSANIFKFNAGSINLPTSPLKKAFPCPPLFPWPRSLMGKFLGAILQVTLFPSPLDLV